MKWIPPGTFTMGSPEDVGEVDERPAHPVTLTKGFWMMEHEVTQGQCEAVMGSNRSFFSKCGRSCPVEQVSWDDAVAFTKRVSARDGVEYRLPTEAQWEYAARGGQSYTYAGSEVLGDVGWYDDNSEWTMHAVCGKRRNGYGLCDMSGNVSEWTADWYGRDYYAASPARDPRGPASGSLRVLRGGSQGSDPSNSRNAYRGWSGPGNRWLGLGLRLVRTAP